jgi:pimeloyl-ACP methyl ester carboxylesterase
LLLFDKRGTGLSDPVAGPATLEERVEDLTAVMEAAGSRQAAVMGVSEGGTMAMLFAAQHPERSVRWCSTVPPPGSPSPRTCRRATMRR